MAAAMTGRLFVGDGFGGGLVVAKTKPSSPCKASASSVDILVSGELALEGPEPNTPLPIAVASVAFGASYLVRTKQQTQLPTTPQILAVFGIGVLLVSMPQACRRKGADDGLSGLVTAIAHAPRVLHRPTCEVEKATLTKPTTGKVDAVGATTPAA